MDRAILSYSPPLERAILRRLTRAPLGGIMRQSAPNFVGWSDRLPPLERQKGEEAGDTSSRRRPFLHGARMMRSTTADAAEVEGGDREWQHDRERHSLLARVTKANPSGCDAATITCSLAAEASGSGPPREPSLGSARRNRQIVPDATVCLDAVPRPSQRPAQLANVLTETRDANCFGQDTGAHR